MDLYETLPIATKQHNDDDNNNNNNNNNSNDNNNYNSKFSTANDIVN